MKAIAATFAVIAACLACGCVTVNENYLADKSLSIEVTDSGWYLFGCVPVVSGNPDGKWPHWFTDDLNPQTTLKVLDRVIARRKAERIGPVVTRRQDENVLVLITRTSYHTSAVIPAKSADVGIKEQKKK